MKIYHHVGRLTVRRHLRRKQFHWIEWALKLKPGALINDCTGFNTYVLNIDPDKFYFKNGGWYIHNVTFETSTLGPSREQDGSCVLFGCGPGPALSREICEKSYLEFLNEWLTVKGPGGADHYYGGLDNPEYKKVIERAFQKWDILKKGGHISDEDGVILSEYPIEL